MKVVLRLAAVLALLPMQQLFAAPGDPDPAFGTFGVSTVSTTTSSDVPRGAVALGLIYVTGTTYRGSTPHLFVARFQADGSLDPTFGAAGRALLTLEHPTEGAMVRQQPDGKLVVVGTHYAPAGYELLVARFNLDGSLDATFGTGGVYTRKVGCYSYGAAVTLDTPASTIVAAGTALCSTNGTQDMIVVRLNSSGAADATFGTAGLAVLDFRGGDDQAYAVNTIGGQVVVAGFAQGPGPLDSSTNDYAIARLNANGTIDTSFGPPAQGGLVTIDVGGASDVVSTATFGSDGYYFAGTSLLSDGTYAFSVVKLTTGGLLDTTFGGTGKVLVSPGPGQNFAYSIAPSLGKILLAGVSNNHFAMARLNTDGTLDSGFGSGGVVIDAEQSAPSGIVAANYDAGGDPTRIIAIGVWPEPGGAQVQQYDIARIRFTGTGARDTTFGTGGKVVTNLYNLSWDARATALMPGGRMVVAGYLYDTLGSDFAVISLQPDGARDYFGFGMYFGITTVGFGKADDRANAILKTLDGKLILGGRSNLLGTGSFALTRLNRYGFVDTTFGTGGRTTHTMGLGFAEINALAWAPGGKIVAAGSALVASGDYDFALARYSANGVLDATFGTGGVVITPFGAQPDIARAVAVQNDGKIVAAGRTGNNFDFAVARYNEDGSLDTGFGSGGKFTIALNPSNSDLAHALAILPDGKILVAGEVVTPGFSTDMVVVRLHANGALDTTFGTSGVATINFGSGPDSAFAMAVQSNDKIVLAGSAAESATGPRGFALARLNADGSTDTGFGSGWLAGGRFLYDLTISVDAANAVALQRDGKIVAAGNAGATSQWAVMRTFGDTRPPYTMTDLDSGGKSDWLYRNVSTGQVYRMLMNGTSISHAAPAYAEPDTAWKIVGDDDFNGDGFTDVLYRNDATGQVAMLPFGPGGRAAGPSIFYTEANLAWKIVHTPDIDGDGRADLLWWNSGTGQVHAMLMDGATIGGQGTFYTEPNTAWKIVAVGDFAGSGKRNQLVWRNSASGVVFMMTVTWNGLGFAQTGSVVYAEPNLAWKIAGVADFNGDGKSDILWRNDANGQVYIMLMDGGTIASQGLMYAEPNLAWKIVALGDYNGDGKADILWRNEATGHVYMMLMNGLAISAQAMVYQESNTAWQLLGPWEYGQASGVLAAAMAWENLPSTFKGPLLNASPGISGVPVNRSHDMTRIYRP